MWLIDDRGDRDFSPNQISGTRPMSRWFDFRNGEGAGCLRRTTVVLKTVREGAYVELGDGA
jgi:hypothetical protein